MTTSMRTTTKLLNVNIAESARILLQNREEMVAEGTMAEDFELERLRAEIAQEHQMKDMLEQSLSEMQLTVDELEKRMEGIDEESNEWKTRFETQTEMNEQLKKQILHLQDKIDDAKNTFARSRLPKSKVEPGQGNEVTSYTLKQLERDKASLEKQLRDFEWRLDQESKAYHKANEERKQYVLEINSAKDMLNELRHRQRVTQSTDFTPRPTGLNTNIRDDQRILDPKRGPIKKTAAVNRLPPV